MSPMFILREFFFHFCFLLRYVPKLDFKSFFFFFFFFFSGRSVCLYVPKLYLYRSVCLSVWERYVLKVFEHFCPEKKQKKTRKADRRTDRTIEILILAEPKKIARKKRGVRSFVCVSRGGKISQEKRFLSRKKKTA